MKIGIMQPYFLPYIGYWQLMNAVDKYVVYDDVNYIKRGWINRNQILVDGQRRYFHIPVRNMSQNRLINETKVDNDMRKKDKSLRMIELAYKRAPYFEIVYPLIENIFNCEEENIVSFLMNSFSIIISYLSIETELLLSSKIEKNSSFKGQEKILNICEHLKADEYYNAIGGRELYSCEIFKKRGIQLYFLQTESIEYTQFNNRFQENLSILDVMMFNSKERVRQMLNKYRLVTR